MSNYILENERRVLEIYREWDRRKLNVGRVEGNRRLNQQAELQKIKDNIRWTLFTMAITAAVILTGIGQ